MTPLAIVDAQDLARMVSELGREIPPFIAEDALAERWPWTTKRSLEEARRSTGKLHVKGRGDIRLPDHIAGGQKVAYYFARRPGIRSVLDVEDELAAMRKSA